MREHFSKLLGLSPTKVDSFEEIKHISVQQIIANPFQPRNHFDDEKIAELAKSIQTNGVIQPIILRPVGNGYEIVAGERRWRASILLGKETIPAIVRILTDEQSASIALIENLQREGLSAIEEAQAYQQLILLQGITQEALAEQIGKSQSSIANKLRLLQLGDRIKDELLQKRISERHARSLLKLEDEEMQYTLVQEIIQRDLSVKQLDTKIKFLLEEQKIMGIKKISYAKDVRLAINTIRQSVEMIKNTGLQVVAEEANHDEFIEINLKIYRKK
jgi:ParB family chromosome partitioning protein